VLVDIIKGRIKIYTWFPLKETSKVIIQYRAGILVKKLRVDSRRSLYIQSSIAPSPSGLPLR
jgi:hypothetical protein